MTHCDACAKASINPTSGRYAAECDDFVSRLRRTFHYDPETGVFTRILRSSNAVMDGRPVGRVNSNGYIVFSFEDKVCYGHRLAWAYMHGEKPVDSIDHINGDRTDNRIANLRVAGFVINAQNQRAARQNSKSGLLGVHLSTRGKKWCAQITANGRTHHLGSFDSAEDGHAAYLDAKRRLHAGCTI